MMIPKKPYGDHDRQIADGAVVYLICTRKENDLLGCDE